MSEELLKTNLLAMILTGVLLALAGLGLYFMRDLVSPYIRYVLPIPPIAVASYVFVFNYFKDVNDRMPTSIWGVVEEIAGATLVATMAFFSLSLFLALLVLLVRRLVSS